MINDKLLVGRLFTPTKNPYYTVYISEQIAPTIFYCKVYIFNRFIYGIDVYEQTIIDNIINGVWEDTTDKEIESEDE